MKLMVFNGSPRTGKNNTEIMINKFLKGFSEQPGNSYEILKLNKVKFMGEAVKHFVESDTILLAFPLYNYSMPSGVKEFIENLEPFCGELSNKKIGFLVQYGFPEATHARPLEKYLQGLVKELNAHYLGTIIKGGCNSLIENIGNIEKQNKRILDGIFQIGQIFGKAGQFNKSLIANYSKPEKSTFITKIIMRFLIKLINKYYWAEKLKVNGVYEQGYARPYEDKNA